MKHLAIKNNLSTLELFIFGLAVILGVGISIILGIYSILKFDISGILIFGIIFSFSLGVFLYVQHKTEGIEA